jgi:sigma-B regulation protein RsbU (phosphoserine phosphatase)
MGPEAAIQYRAMAWLLALNGDLLGKWFALEAPCLVGRAALNHVIIDDPRISRQHAKIAQEEGGYVLYDLNSANGTFVDEQPVKRRKLEFGQTIRFGPYAFSFKETRERAPAAPAPGAFGHHLEVRTLMGMQPPVKIVGSLDAVSDDLSNGASLTVMEDAFRKLSTLYGFMRSIATSLETEALVDRICINLLDTFNAHTVEVFFYDEHSGTLRPIRSMERGATPGVPRALSAQVIEEVVRRGRAILSAPRLAVDSSDGTGHAMHAPMVNGNRVQGVIAVRDRDREGKYSQRDLDLLVGLAAVAALSLQNARMHAELLRQQRLEQDLRLAQQIQKSFLPRSLPKAARVEFHADYLPVFTVGGDFYDFFWIDERRVGVFIGDVAGKGVAAALLMARVSSDLRVAVLADGRPKQVMARINQAMLEREQPEVFVTGIFLTLDVESGKVVLANAGHCPPLVRRHGGGVERVDGGHSTAIGFFRDSFFTETELTLGPGDAIVLYTDGIIEATNAGGEQFGGARLAECLLPTQGAQALAERVLAHVQAHAATSPLGDDITLLVCAVKAA